MNEKFLFVFLEKYIHSLQNNFKMRVSAAVYFKPVLMLITLMLNIFITSLPPALFDTKDNSYNYMFDFVMIWICLYVLINITVI